MGKTYGVIDIGSNTIRFAIYTHESAGRFREIDNIKTVARLRNYLDEEENLSEEGIQVLLNTLQSYQDIADYHGITHVKGAATATIRRAKNQAEILRRMNEMTSFTINVFSEYEEAYYGYLAVMNSIAIEDGLTIDIGGGSTEVTLFKGRELLQYHSFPFGALSLKRRFVSGEVPTKQERENISAFLKEQFNSLEWLRNQSLPVVGIGGSARNTAQVHQAMVSYPVGGLHQYEMKQADIQSVLTHLKDQDIEKMKKVDGLSEDRADIIVPAVQVFQQFTAIVGAPTFILSRKGLRDGIFYEELMRPHGVKIFPNVLEESLFELTTEYNINTEHSLQISRLAQTMMIQLESLGVMSFSEDEVTLLKRAASVFYLGDYIDSESGSQHTFYVLANRTIDGLTHLERLQLALTASFKSKSVFKQYAEPYCDWISKPEQKRLRVLGALLKTAASLNATKRNIVHDVKLEKKDDGLHFLVCHQRQVQAEKYQTNKQKKHLEKALKCPIHLHFELGR
ncbi:Ppx/GppA family phosphatase [Bacillus tianshenii]|nr:Ppx/GppA family phosphatase [Bacillus tianshenii]